MPAVPGHIEKQTPGDRKWLRISVITPAYNPGPDLAITVEALNSQSLTDFEWILVDDCSSSEHQTSIAAAWKAANFPVTVVRHNRNTRQAQARNTGLQHASAAYIKFVDADDAIDPLHLEALLAAAEAQSTARAIPFAPTRHVFVGRNNEIENRSYRDLPPDRNAQLSRMLIAPFLHHCGALFPRQLLEDLGGYDPSLVTDEDGDLLLRVLLAGWQFEAVPGISYIYRHHDGGDRVSRDDTSDKIDARCRVGERVLSYFQNRGEDLPEGVKAALCQRFDALAVRNWQTNRAKAESLVAAALALDAGYDWSGSFVERAVRRFAGIGSAYRFISTLRTIRGVSFR